MRPPDEIDIRLMQELASPASYRWNINEPLSSMAKKLNVDEDTVRRRLKRIHKGGLIRGYHLIPNPHLLGLKASEVDQLSSVPKDSVIPQLMLLDGVILLIDFHGSGIRILLYYKSEEELSRKNQLIRSICGSGDQVSWKDSFPPCDLKLKETDWRILMALRKDARRGLSEVAEQIGVSVRTVRRRIEVMTEGKAFFLLPLPDFTKVASVLCNFRVYCPDEKSKRGVDERLRAGLKKVLFSKTSMKDYSLYTVLCDNLEEAERTRSWIESMAGVQGVWSGFSKRLIPVTAWLDEVVVSRLERSRSHA